MALSGGVSGKLRACGPPYLHTNTRITERGVPLMPFRTGKRHKNAPKAGNHEAHDLLKEADDLLALMAQGKLPKRVDTGAASVLADQASLEEGGFQLQCDVNGCSIVPVAKSDAAPSLTGSFVGTKGQRAGGNIPNDFALAEGKGWKLGCDRAPSSPDAYSALVGSDAFSIAMTAAEYDDFVKLLMNLRQSVATLQICGEWQGEKQEAMLEMSTERVWVQGRAPQKRLAALQDLWRVGRGGPASNKAFALRFIIKSADKREVEGSWSAEVVMEVLQHLDGENPELVHTNGQEVFEGVAA